MPVTCGADVGRDARHRRHSAVRRASSRRTRSSASVFARAHGTRRSPTRRWLGIPGSAVLYVVYVLGLAAALLTADLHDADDALHLPRPEPDRRAGARAPARGAVGHDRPARRARRAERRSAAGSTCRRCSPLGRSARCEHWLEPVVGERRCASPGGDAARVVARTEYALIGAAVVDRRRRHRYRLRAAQARDARAEGAGAARSTGFERVLANKYYVDEAYDAAIVSPTVGVSRSVLWRGVDVGHHRRPARRTACARGVHARLFGVGCSARSCSRAGRHVRLGARRRRAAVLGAFTFR